MTAQYGATQIVALPTQRRRAHHMRVTSLGILTTLACLATLRLASALVLPVVLALLFALVLSPVVRWLHRRHIPEQIGAAIVVFGAAGCVAAGAAALVRPATEFISWVPASMQQVESTIRRVAGPLAAIQNTARKVEEVATPAAAAPRVSIASSGFLNSVSGMTVTVGLAVFSTIFLTYFLLASGPMFRRKLADTLPSRFERSRVTQVLDEIGLVTSHYLLLSLMINTGVAIATAACLFMVGMPNALVWGGIVGLLNFVPYLGALTSVCLLTLASIAAGNSTGNILLPPLIFFGIHLVESNLVTPTILGRRLPLSPIVIFLAILSWGWMFGLVGAVIAVPLTVVIKVACDHVPGLERIGMLLND